MKRVKSLCLVAVMLVSLLASCGGKDAGNGKPEQGVWAGDAYTSKSAGFVFNKPEGWSVATEEELAEMVELGKEMTDTTTSGNAFWDKMLEMQTFYDLYCTDETTGSSVLLMYENLKVSGSTKMTEAEYMAVLEEGIMATGLYDSATIEDSIDMAGKTYSVMTSTVELYGMTMSQRYLVSKQGDYMLVLALTVMPGVSLEELQDCFVAIS